MAALAVAYRALDILEHALRPLPEGLGRIRRYNMNMSSLAMSFLGYIFCWKEKGEGAA